MTISWRKEKIIDYNHTHGGERDKWLKKGAFYQDEIKKHLCFEIPKNQRILALGCGLGDVLSALSPHESSIGIDLSPELIKIAEKCHPDLTFIAGDFETNDVLEKITGTFDIILMVNTIGLLDDCQGMLENLRPFCHGETRMVMTYYGRGWSPLVKFAEKIKIKMPTIHDNNLTTRDMMELLQLANYQVIKRDWRILSPYGLLGIGWFINRFLATLPVIRRFSLMNMIVARPLLGNINKKPSVTVLIPTRNEMGNVEPAIKRLPEFGSSQEIIFIEGGSSDGTPGEIKRVIATYPNKNIQHLTQTGKGKGDAMRLGFSHANGDIVMILDGDLTTPPEDMPKFYDVLTSNKGEFVNGTRLIYPMQDDAMRFLNFIANKLFSWGFTWVLGQRFTDTLCGTKVLWREDYEKIAHNRHFFGDFDPFGDFDLIFGAVKLNLKVVEVPVRYRAREYGETQISRFRHGWLLIKMWVYGWWKMVVRV